jgi:hypothetical protein
MSKVLVYVEGQTEETFVGEVLAPHLSKNGIYLIAALATTKRVKSGTDFKGGIVSYGKTRNDILRLVHDTSAALVTTMIDFYGLPADFPGRKNMPTGSCYKRVAHLEEEFLKDIDHLKFLPYLALHEFEAMLFVSPHQIAETFPNVNVREALLAIRADFKSPEEINDDPQTAPSKRLAKILPRYQKPLYGPLIARKIGLDLIRNECPHFNDWLKKLEVLS